MFQVHESGDQNQGGRLSEQKWFYLSFTDDRTGSFLGGCFVQGETMHDAVVNSWKLNCNPGGHVRIAQLADHEVVKTEGARCRLLTRAEMEQRWGVERWEQPKPTARERAVRAGAIFVVIGWGLTALVGWALLVWLAFALLRALGMVS